MSNAKYDKKFLFFLLLSRARNALVFDRRNLRNVMYLDMYQGFSFLFFFFDLWINRELL